MSFTTLGNIATSLERPRNSTPLVQERNWVHTGILPSKPGPTNVRGVLMTITLCANIEVFGIWKSWFSQQDGINI